jgi:SAM-dependent methyltransferase
MTTRRADLGCGPGHVTAHLRGLGLDVFGIDLSPAMVAEASRRYPQVRFVEGSLTALDVPDGTLAGALAWYSTIHLAPAALPVAFAELRRALAPGCQLLVAFQVGDEASVREEAFGRPISLAFHRWQPDAIARFPGRGRPRGRRPAGPGPGRRGADPARPPPGPQAVGVTARLARTAQSPAGIVTDRPNVGSPVSPPCR